MIAPGFRVLCRSEHHRGEGSYQCLKLLSGRFGRSDDSMARLEHRPARGCLIHHCHFVPVRGPGRPGARRGEVPACSLRSHSRRIPPVRVRPGSLAGARRAANRRAGLRTVAPRGRWRVARARAPSLAGVRPRTGAKGREGTAKGRVRWAKDAIWAGLPSRTCAGPRTGAQAGRRTTFRPAGPVRERLPTAKARRAGNGARAAVRRLRRLLQAGPYAGIGAQEV